jgi:hypothetical protein
MMSKMEHMSLHDMGKQYALEADNLVELITACKERRRFAVNGGNSEEAKRQERLIELHTQQRNDLLRLAAWLKHYYDGTEYDQPRKEDALYADYHGCIA